MKKVLTLFLTLAMIVSMSSVVSFAEDTDTTFTIGTGTYGSLNDPNKVPMTEVAGLGGKADDDTAMAFVLDGAGCATSIRWQYPLTHINASDVATSGGSKGIYFAFNIYADGDVTARICYAGSYDIIKWNPDGTAKVTGLAEPITLERGKWHKVVLSMNDQNGGRFGGFIDGVKIPANVDSTWNSITGKGPLGFGFEAGSKNGIVAFDDAYSAYWSGSESYTHICSQDLPVYSGAENLTFDSEKNTITYNDEAFSDVASLEEAIQSAFSNAVYAGLFNADLSEHVEIVSDAKVLAVKLNTGAYHYFNVKKEEFTPISVEFVGDTTNVGAVSLFSNTTSSDKTLVMILVFKDENGVIQKLLTSEEISIASGEENVEVLIEPVEAEGLNAEVFFIESWATRLRLLDEIYKNY